MYSLLKFIIWLGAMFVLLLFVDVFSDQYSELQRAIILVLCIVYAVLPYFWKKYQLTSIDLRDERNAFLLAIGGLFFLYTITFSFSYSFLSIESLLSIFSGILMLMFIVYIIKLGAPSADKANQLITPDTHNNP